jgi:MFS family permease
LEVLSGLNLFYYLDRYVAVVVAEPIRFSCGLTDRLEGQLNTAFMLGYFLTAPVFGYLGDLPRRRVPMGWTACRSAKRVFCPRKVEGGREQALG